MLWIGFPTSMGCKDGRASLNKHFGGSAKFGAKVVSSLEKSEEHKGIITTSGDLVGYSIEEHLGVAHGIVVRSTGVVRGCMRGIRAIGGGNIPEYVAVCEEACQQVYGLAVPHANDLGGDGIVGMHYDTPKFLQGGNRDSRLWGRCEIQRA